MPRKNLGKRKARKTSSPTTEYGQLGRSKRLLLAALKVWELKQFGRVLPD
jgi:hypothetical protein